MPTQELKLIKRNVGCANSLLSVFLDKIVTSDEKVIENYIVVSPKIKKDDHESGVVILPFVDTNILLIKVFRHPLEEYVWELPRGFIDAGETAVEAAIRELQEETGISVTSENLVDLGLVAPEGGGLSAKNHIYSAKNCTVKLPLTVSEHGHKSIHLFSHEEIKNMLKKNEILDSNTIVALYRYFFI